ncbi:rRNA maturation RNase YbeY [Candidatus Erwinia haradaeae]|uniref:Endoribonuclease YbeY n=1 Tax=Candidatus Erwinia haradaeae TaxID=1922217 RepID=A0A451D496_9GAMM|nr:rRNA maturation RNase YbeY [Candidatus Erwinia haradaeae]VFP80498.1 Endoribonuclease YbeY [Candidatus Erwinia haradaeae]
MSVIILNLQIACSMPQGLPKKSNFLKWVSAALPKCKQKKEITIRLVDEKESRALNWMFCKKNQPTNILSFPFTAPSYIKIPLLGDLVICRQVVELEALSQNKSLEAHWAHMTIHGSLHLLGYDHSSQSTAEEMEKLETKIILLLGYSDPYIANIE